MRKKEPVNKIPRAEIEYLLAVYHDPSTRFPYPRLRYAFHINADEVTRLVLSWIGLVPEQFESEELEGLKLLIAKTLGEFVLRVAEVRPDSVEEG